MNTKASQSRRLQRENAERQAELDARNRRNNANLGTAIDDFPLSDVVTPAHKLPDPCLIDSTYFIAELDRIRELALKIPRLANEQILPVQTLLDGLWRLREQFRELLSIVTARQTDWRSKHDTPDETHLSNQDAGRQTDTRTVKARRRDAARVA